MRYADKVYTWTVTGFLSPDESKLLADKVITMISDYNGTADEMGRLSRYMGQSHRYTVAQGRDIEGMWGVFKYPKKSRRRKK